MSPRGMRTLFAGEESCGRTLREDDRGAAALRSDMPHRGRNGRACVDQTGRLSGNGGRSSSTFTSCHRQCARRPRCALCLALACLVPSSTAFAPRIAPALGRVGGRVGWRRRHSRLGPAPRHSPATRPSRSSSPFDHLAPWLASSKVRWLRPASGAFVAGLMALLPR